MTSSQPVELITVTTSEARKAIITAIKANRPVFLWGKPGIGKSDLVRQVGAELQFDSVIDIRLSQLDAVDLRGLPTVEDGVTTWARPVDLIPLSGRHLIFLDELNRAELQVMNSSLQYALDRRIGPHVLPTDCRIIAAGNYEGDGGGVKKLISASGNRFLHLNVVPDLAPWSTWAVSHDISPVVIAYHRFKGGASLHRFDASNRFDQAFPSPRSWHIVSDLFKADPDADIELALYCGTVGKAEGIDFKSFADLYRQLPNLDAIIMDPQNADVPTNVGALYAVSAGLAARATDSNLSRIMQYLERLPTEYNVFSVKDAIGRDKSLAVTPEYTAWTVKHQEMM